MSRLKNLLNSLIEKIFLLLPINKKKILFVSHLGKNYSCNPRYLCEYLYFNHSEDYQLYWIYDKVIGMPKNLPTGIKVLPFFSRQYLYHISTCGLLVSNTRLPEWFHFHKREGQRYLQTWHSSLRLKCIEGDANLSEKYIKTAKKDSSLIDAIVSGCEFSSNTFKNSFWYKGPILKTGTPRIDALLKVNTSDKSYLFEKTGLRKGISYALYAPTFRKDDSTDCYNVDYDLILAALKACFGGDWKVLFRLHPNLMDKISLKFTSDNVIDMTRYDDIQDLLCLSNLLITDYSSSMFDMAILKKPCFLYMPDLEEYLVRERKLYFDIDSLPFPRATSNEELAEKLKTFNLNSYKKEIEDFLLKIGSYEKGNSCSLIYNEFIR